MYGWFGGLVLCGGLLGSTEQMYKEGKGLVLNGNI